MKGDKSTAGLSMAAANLLRDVKDPLFNLKNFHAEINDAVVRMQALLPDDGSSLVEAEINELRLLLRQDFVPCLFYTGQSIDLIQSRLEAFEQIHRVSVAD